MLTIPTEVALAGSVNDRLVNRLASRRSGVVWPSQCIGPDAVGVEDGVLLARFMDTFQLRFV